MAFVLKKTCFTKISFISGHWYNAQNVHTQTFWLPKVNTHTHTQTFWLSKIRRTCHHVQPLVSSSTGMPNSAPGGPQSCRVQSQPCSNRFNSGWSKTLQLRKPWSRLFLWYFYLVLVFPVCIIKPSGKVIHFNTHSDGLLHCIGFTLSLFWFTHHKSCTFNTMQHLHFFTSRTMYPFYCDLTTWF